MSVNHSDILLKTDSEKAAEKAMVAVSRMRQKEPVKVADNLYACPTCGVGLFLKEEQCRWCGQCLEWK